MFEVVIIGAGPAGLSAALILGRSRRNVLVCDTGEHRNSASHAMHGFLTRDGIAPMELLRLARDQLRPYDTIELRSVKVVDAIHHPAHFELTLADDTHITSRKLILATGVVDELPPIEGAEAFYGQGVFHCPYCDGWEHRDQPIAIYGAGKHGRKLALELRQWSHDLTLCTNGPAQLSSMERERLTRHNIQIREERITRLEGNNGVLERIVFTNDQSLECRALFFRGHEQQRSDLPEKLGCTFSKKGAVRTGDYEATNVPGLYVVGDASRRVQFAIIAAAEGAAAAWAINTELLKEDLASRYQEDKKE